MLRFWSKVKKTQTCWLWTGANRGKTGYGCLKINKKVIDAHRVSWQLAYGEIPKDKYVCHTCDNRTCVNPKHLFLGNAKINFDDARIKGRLTQLGANKKWFSKEEKNAHYRPICLEYWHRRGKYLREIRRKNIAK